jgi:hypothetical protein
MSLAERPQTSPSLRGVDTNPYLRWVEHISVEERGFEPRNLIEEDENFTPPVDSKDLFREVESLPNSERFQGNIGRELHRFRYSDIPSRQTNRFFKKPRGERTLTEPGKPPRQVSLDNLMKVLEEVVQGIHANSEGSPTEVRKAIETALNAFQSSLDANSQTETVLESFEGFVDQIDGDTAFVRLKSREHGDVLYGEHSAEQLLAKGIEEQTRFLCKTIKANGATRVELQAIPRTRATEQQLRAIDEKIDKVLPRDDPGVEY